MSKIVFDSYIKPGDTVSIAVYREDGSLEQLERYVSDVYGNFVSIVTEES